MTQPLTNCPFCAHDDELLVSRIGAADELWWEVFCDFCCTHGPTAPTEAEAIAAWNHRSLSIDRSGQEIQDTGASVPDQALVASDQAAARLAPPGFDPSRLVGLLRALAHDCEPTDGWEDAGRTVQEAADRLLVLGTRLSDLNQWALTDHVTEPAASAWEEAWDEGYASARRMVAHRIAPDAIAMEAATAGETLESGSTRSATARAEGIAHTQGRSSETPNTGEGE